MAKQVKTYRVLREPQKVGDSVRMFGDLIPEAASFPNLRAYLNSNVIEEIFVDQSVIDDFYKELEERAAAAEVEDDDEDEGGGEDPVNPDEGKGDPETDPEDKKPAKKSQPKKRVAKKTTVKKKTTRKKAESSGKQLEERSV